jgi:hypothetical protein
MKERNTNITVENENSAKDSIKNKMSRVCKRKKECRRKQRQKE